MKLTGWRKDLVDRYAAKHDGVYHECGVKCGCGWLADINKKKFRDGEFAGKTMYYLHCHNPRCGKATPWRDNVFAAYVELHNLPTAG